MATFLGVHKIPGELTEEEIKQGWAGYRQKALEMGLKPLGAVYSMEKGFAYCQTEAESAEKVKEAHAGASVPLEEVVEIQKLEG